MSNTYNTNKRRVVNRYNSIDVCNGYTDQQFCGDRYGNQRKQVAELKKRERRIQRSKQKCEMHKLNDY